MQTEEETAVCPNLLTSTRWVTWSWPVSECGCILFMFNLYKVYGQGTVVISCSSVAGFYTKL
jgi:hypothetical protein